jgi:hypothetical protein
MSTTGATAVSPESISNASSQKDKAELAILAAATALRVQRQQADALVGLIEQAGDDKGRYISVRA